MLLLRKQEETYNYFSLSFVYNIIAAEEEFKKLVHTTCIVITYIAK